MKIKKYSLFDNYCWIREGFLIEWDSYSWNQKKRLRFSHWRKGWPTQRDPPSGFEPKLIMLNKRYQELFFCRTLELLQSSWPCNGINVTKATSPPLISKKNHNISSSHSLGYSNHLKNNPKQEAPVSYWACLTSGFNL